MNYDNFLELRQKRHPLTCNAIQELENLKLCPDMEKSRVIPLGVFGSLASDPPSFAKAKSLILPLVGRMDQQDQHSVIHFLSGGAIVFASMGQTRDLLGDAFEATGGSSILTDGTYFWRRDTIDYVRHYSVGLPDAFLEHGRALRWTPPGVTPERVLEIHDYLQNAAPRGVLQF